MNDINPAPSADSGIPADQRQWAMIAHLSALAGFIIPLGNVIGPLIVWMVKRDTMPFVDDQAKEALNFQITVSIAAVIAAVLVVIVIGLLLLPLVALGALVFIVIAGIKANEGVTYRYPFTLRLVN